MPRGYDLYAAQEGAATDNRGRGIYPDPEAYARGAATRGQTFKTSGQQTAPGLEGFLDILRQFGVQSGGSSSFSQQPVMPPVLELLGEMRARRMAEAEKAATLAGILSSNLPAGMTVYPGFEGGGLADVLLGIITGKGVEASRGLIPDAARQVQRVNVPVPGAEPPVGAEFGDAASMANAIMNAIRVFTTGGSSSTQSGGGDIAGLLPLLLGGEGGLFG